MGDRSVSTVLTISFDEFKKSNNISALWVNIVAHNNLPKPEPLAGHEGFFRG